MANTVYPTFQQTRLVSIETDDLICIEMVRTAALKPPPSNVDASEGISLTWQLLAK